MTGSRISGGIHYVNTLRALTLTAVNRRLLSPWQCRYSRAISTSAAKNLYDGEEGGRRGRRERGRAGSEGSVW